MHALADGAFDPGAPFVALLKRLRLLARTGGLQGLVLRLRTHVEGTWASNGSGAGGAFGTGTTPIPVKRDGEYVGRALWFAWNGSAWVQRDLLGFDLDHGHSLAIADVNADGNQDIFLAEMRLNSGNSDAKSWLLLGDGAGGFTRSELSTGLDNHTGQSGNNMIYTRPTPVGSAYTLTAARHSGSVDTLYVNGTVVLTQNGKLGPIGGAQSTGQLGRGYNNNPYFNGDIAEVLVYSRALSDAELRTVQRYLLQKYFPALPLPASLTDEEQAAPPTDTPEATPNDVPTETPTTP